MCQKGVKILHVDDELNDRELTEIYLRRHMRGIQFFSLGNAHEALEMLQKQSVDCILSDYQMPTMNGMEFLQQLRSQDDETPFIFLTGQGNEEIAASALRNGADDYYSKHESIAHYDRLVNSIRRVVRSQRERRNKERIEAELQHYGGLLNETFNEIYVVDEDTKKFIRANQAALNNLQYTREELMDLSPYDLVCQKEVERLQPLLDEFYDRKTDVMTFNTRHRRKDGTTYPLRARVKRMHLNGMEVSVGVISDISEQVNVEGRLKETTVELKESNSSLNAILELSRLISGPDRTPERICKGAAEALLEGLKEEGASGVRLRLFDQTFTTTPLRQADNSITTQIRGYNRQVGALTVWFEDTAHRYANSAKLLLTVFTERLGSIYERLDLEKQLDRSRDQHQKSTESILSLLDESNTLILLIEPDTGKIFWANSTAHEFYGYGGDRLTSMKISEINQLNEKDIELEMQQARKKKRNYFVFPHKCGGGTIHMMQVYSSPVSYENRRLLLSIIHEFKNTRAVVSSIQRQILRETGSLDHPLNERCEALLGKTRETAN